MKFLIIHNRYSRPGGEENVVQMQCRMLKQRGHSVELYERDYAEMANWRFGRVAGLLTAMGNAQAVRELRALVRRHRPDVAIVHNLFPVISPAVLPMLKQEGVAVMMTLHNYRLVCPNGLFFTHSQICERCANSCVREWNCVLRGCQGGMLGSTAFALRGYWARKVKGYWESVDKFLALSAFQQNKLVAAGFETSKFAIVPNAIDADAMPWPRSVVQGEYIAFVGRLSVEKGVELLLDTARRMPHRKFKVAGAKSLDIEMVELPENVELVGFLNREQLAEFYCGAKCVILSSRCYDNFPLSVIEAMYYQRAVVVPNLAALSEIVNHGNAGLLYDTPQEFISQIERVFTNDNLREELQKNGRKRVDTLYNIEAYYNNIMWSANELVGDK